MRIKGKRGYSKNKKGKTGIILNFSQVVYQKNKKL
jgi:hypothetical protein